MKVEHVLFHASVFFKITDPCAGRSFSMCSHDPIFGPNKNRILKNGSCERALRKNGWKYLSLSGTGLVNPLCRPTGSSKKTYQKRVINNFVSSL